MIPQPLVCSLAEQGLVLLARGRVYQPSRKTTDTYIVRGENQEFMEPAATLRDLEQNYMAMHEPLLKQLKQEHIEKIQGVKAQDLQELERRRNGDFFRMWYVTEVQNVYLESMDSKNEFTHARRQTKAEKKAYLDVLCTLEKRFADTGGCNVELPKYAMLADHNAYKLRRKFFSSKKTAAVIQGSQFVVAQEVGHLDCIKERATMQLEQRLLKEWEQDNASITDALEKVSLYKSAIASGVTGKNGLEYQNFGFGHCNSAPVVYLRKETGSSDAVAVYLKRRFDKVTYNKAAFCAFVNNNIVPKEFRADVNDHIVSRVSGICLAGFDFARLNWNLRKQPKGVAAIRFLHNVRDRVWPPMGGT